MDWSKPSSLCRVNHVSRGVSVSSHDIGTEDILSKISRIIEEIYLRAYCGRGWVNAFSNSDYWSFAESFSLDLIGDPLYFWCFYMSLTVSVMVAWAINIIIIVRCITLDISSVLFDSLSI